MGKKYGVISKITINLDETIALSRAMVKKYTLRKQAYSNILKILLQKKKWKFSDTNSDIFHYSTQNIDCGTR